MLKTVVIQAYLNKGSEVSLKYVKNKEFLLESLSDTIWGWGRGATATIPSRA
jgi:hypothetical protein